MASLNQVTLELKVSGERAATKALKDFAEANKRVGSSLGELGRKISSIEGEYKNLINLKQQGVIRSNALRSAEAALAAQLARLTGETQTQALAQLRAIKAAERRAQADSAAAAAADKLSRSQRNLEDSVLKQARAVDQAVSRMRELERLKASGAVGSRNMAQAELEIARALAITNGYLKANGALNTQKALAEMRAAQETRKATMEQQQQNAANASARQGYNQLMAAIDPTIAKQQRMAQAIQTVRAAHRAGIITAEQASVALRQYQAALDGATLAGNRSALGMNRVGVLTQQAGYQFGDFAVQVQSGTNVMVALGQQATQLVGTFAMLSRSTRNIAIFSALGVAVPVLTAIGAGLMRANVEADAIYKKFGFLEGSVRGLASAFGAAGGFILNILATITQNLDVFVTILGVAAVAAIIKFTAATATMGTVLTGAQLLFSGMAGAQLVAASATATLTAAMSRLMIVISAHPIIAAMTAALAAAVFILYRARDASSGYRSNIEGLSDALKELRNNAKEAGIETARIQLGADTGAQALAMGRIEELNTLIAEQERSRQNAASRQGQALAQARLDALIAERDEIQKLIEADRERVRLMERATAQSSLDAIISSYDEQYATQIKINDAQESLNQAVRLGLIDHETMVEIMAEYEASLNGSVDAMKDFLEHQKGVNDLIEAGRKAEIDRNRTYMDMMREKRNEIRMQEIINQHGQDSVAVVIERARQEAIVAKMTQTQRENYIDAAVEAYNVANATKDIGDNISVAVTQANALARALDAAANAGTSRQRQIAVLRAQIEAAQAGASTQVAAARAGTAFDITTAGGGSVESRAAAAVAASEAGTVEQLQKRLNDLTSTTTPTATGGGGGSTQADPLKQLQDRIVLEEELLGKTEAQRQVIQALGVDWQSYDTNAVNAIINSIEAMDELNRKAEQQQQIANVIESSMERAMMSIVDGTMSVKDAFKSMASEIIKELYRIFVVKQITGMIASAVTGGPGMTSAPMVNPLSGLSGAQMLPSANGNVFNGGNVIPFAMGGVVSRATTFPMSDGRTGLMGEAGPEAIMPLKRGKGGKLGVVAEGGGNVVVNNHFNISANGDDSVKRIVRGEIPRITEATKAAVIDAKLRGGSYGRSFG